jgi:hypothetical protein
MNPFLELAGIAQPWQEVTLPHDSLIEQDRSPGSVLNGRTGYYPSGAFEYVKTFTAPSGYRDGRVEVQFDGVYRHATVYVNGSFAGHRPSGYAPFRFRIDHLLKDGDNDIRVECRAHEDSRWYSGAGIYRDVTLLTGGPLSLAADGVRITTREADAERAVLDVAATVQNDSRVLRKARLAVDMVGPTGAVVASADVPVSARPAQATLVRQRMTLAAPDRWSPENPALYTCRLRLVVDSDEVDTVNTTFGIRLVQWDAIDGLRINGEVVKLRGGCIHHDNGVLGTAAIARAEERRVEILKAAGFNAIRSSHNPISSAMLDACDRLGLLVMDEAFDTWNTPKSEFDYSLDFSTWWREDLAAMVIRDYNHPSVILYSIGNEIPELGLAWDSQLGRDMVELVKTLDETRPVTNGVNLFMTFQHDIRIRKNLPEGVTPDVGINTLMSQLAETGEAGVITTEPVTERVDESLSILDVAGYNYATARYEFDMQLHPQRLIVGTEADVKNLEGTWELVMSHPRVIGDFTWTAWDYIGEVGIARPRTDEDGAGFMGPFPWRLAGIGDIDICGRRRALSFYRETVWGLRDTPYIAVHRPDSAGPPRSGWGWADAIDNWSWPGFEGQTVKVDVYADADEVELVCNGESLGRTKVGEERRYIASFETSYVPGELSAVAFRGGQQVGQTVLSTADPDVVVKVVPDREVVHADDRDLAFVDISLADSRGTVHVLQDRPITVTVTGAGRLQGLGSAQPKSDNKYTDNSCDTFAGRALAVVRPTGAGNIIVTVEAPDCAPVTTTIIASKD